MKYLVLTILMIAGAVILWKLDEPNRVAHNKYMCAVYGYYEDCKTKLPEELRLK